MPSKPSGRKVPTTIQDHDIRLAIKDGLREVRFNLQHGAHRLAQAVEDATHLGEASSHGPLSIINAPLRMAVRTTATLLSNVDHVTVDLLSSDGPYRAMSVPIRSSASYLSDTEATAEQLRLSTKDHFWRLRHWLALNQRDNVFVREKAVEQACVLAARKAPVQVSRDSHEPSVEPRYLAGAVFMLALIDQEILSRPALADRDDIDDLADLTSLGAVCIVLAGEVGEALIAKDVRARYACAIEYANEIALAGRQVWEDALKSPDPAGALGRWLGFVARYI